MAELLFVTWDGGGNVPPAVAIARELAARGHGVRFVGHAAQREALRANGLVVFEGARAQPFRAADPHTPLQMLSAFADDGMGQDMLAAIEQRPVDLVVIDCLMFGALRAAERAGLRYAVLEHLYDGFYDKTFLRPPIGLYFWLRGHAPRRALAAAALRLVITLPELDPIRDPPSNLVQVGPLVEVGERQPGEGAREILVSLSTFGFPGMESALKNAVRGAASTGARVVVTTGPMIDPAVLAGEAGVEVHRYVPHKQLMPRASLFIGHGGHGSTMQALAHDLPVIILPMAAEGDQPWVGRSAAALGAGRLLKKTASAAAVAAAARELLAEGPHRDAARRVGAGIRERRGLQAGADALEAAARAGAAVAATPPAPAPRAPLSAS